MQRLLVLLCLVVSLASARAQQPVAASGTGAPLIAFPTPASIEAPTPIAPPVEAPTSAKSSRSTTGNTETTMASGAPVLAPAVPGTVESPNAPPIPAIPGPVEAPPSTGDSTSSAKGSVVGNDYPKTLHDFQGEDTDQVIRILARQANINIVISDKVSGKITMRLTNLTPLQAIKVIVTAKGLIMDQTEGTYYIKTAAEGEKEPTDSDFYTFSYATAEKVCPLLGTQILCGVPPQFDQRTNTVYYRDYKSNLARLKFFLRTVDIPTQQVMIEARLVEVNANPQQSYGINWAGTVGSAASPQTFQFGGSTLGTTTIANSTKTDPTTGSPIQVQQIATMPSASTSGLQNFVFGGASLKAIAGQFAILDAPQMSATLRFLNEDTEAEFLANPRVVTANNLKATIKITRNQPVPQLNFNSQTASAVFGGFLDKEFGSTLSVTPTINKDDFVTMLVKPEISNKVADETFTFTGVAVSSPIIDTRSLESTVLIKSGDTLAIGGLLQDEGNKARTKVPVLGDIPILGYAFQEHLNARTKRNLLVFVTPTIIRQGYGTGLENQISGLKYSGEEYADPNGWRNNAKGAVRIVPTSNRPNSADYPKPGVPPPPKNPYLIDMPSRD